MQFIKNLFKQEELIIGLSGLKKTKEFVKINIPNSYKKAYIPKTTNNYLLI